ncbi:DUF4236 domain-containing protein [Nocardia rosealba]|uniref:DUF4236 domain-containing protein n=1 Tax=Nocardia rosealba TaxID=2878563 RepID=UPI001CD9E572|nr:DUF4236 domain-containing protein [Nocardia rosealba]MCA2210572.1 DUF4236 domain-containing protein [Nocardia rosealba]
MGIYVRQSLKAGPFRFNLSNSGIGVSAGVPGFRIGSGPRGNYVHAGAHGVYYRASLGGARTLPPRQINTTRQPPGNPIPMADLTGADAIQLLPTGPGDLIEQLNSAAATARTAPWAAAVFGILVLVTFPLGLLILVIAVPVVWWLSLFDQARQNVVVFYDVTDQPAVWFATLTEATSEFAASQGKWRVNAQGGLATVHQRKTHGNASTVLGRAPVTVGFDNPHGLVTNVAVPTITCGNDRLYFLPDRLLVGTGKRYSDVSYTNLWVQTSVHRFIESGPVPLDGIRVDTTWQFANVKGGPDRRFKNNRMLPVMQYGRVRFATHSGLNWDLQFSRTYSIDRAATALQNPPPLPQISGTPRRGHLLPLARRHSIGDAATIVDTSPVANTAAYEIRELAAQPGDCPLDRDSDIVELRGGSAFDDQRGGVA